MCKRSTSKVSNIGGIPGSLQTRLIMSHSRARFLDTLNLCRIMWDHKINLSSLPLYCSILHKSAAVKLIQEAKPPMAIHSKWLSQQGQVKYMSMYFLKCQTDKVVTITTHTVLILIVPDGASLAKQSGRIESQKAAKQMKKERQMVDKERVLEEEEPVDGESPKEAALTEELLAQNIASLRADQAVKPELVAGKTEWEKKPIESDLASIEKEITPQEEITSESRAKAERMATKHKAAHGEEVLGGFESEEEKVEDTKFSKPGAAKREEYVRWQTPEAEESTEEVTEASKVLKTGELGGIKMVERDMHEAKESVKGKYETKEALEATFAEKITIGEVQEKVGETEPEEKVTFQEKKYTVEAGKRASIMEKKRKDDTFLREDENIEEGKYELSSISLTEAGLTTPKLQVGDVLSRDEKAVSDGSDRKVPSEMEEIIQGISSRWDEELYQDVNGMKAISTEDLALEKIEPRVEEAFLDHETERVILAEEEHSKITEESKSADQPYSEKEKEKGTEESLMSKMAPLEEKLDIEKEELSTETSLEAMALLKEESLGKEKAKGEMWAEELEGEMKGLSRGKKMIEEEQIALRGKAEAEEGEAEMALKGEAETDEAEREVKIKGEVGKEEVGGKVQIQWEAEGDKALKRKAETEEAKAEVGPKEQLEVTEAEAEMTLNREAETGQVKAKVVPKGELEAKEAEAEVTLKREAEIGQVKAKMVPKGELEAKEPEAEVTPKKEAETGQVKAEMVPKGELDAEEAEAEVTLKREAETGQVRAKVVPKGELDAEEAEAEVTLKREAETGQVKAKIVPKGELDAKEAGAEVTLKEKAETGQVKAKAVPKGELEAEEAEVEVTLKREAETVQIKAKVVPKGELEAEEAEVE
ncbi:plectin-like, partial [Python bivittatus]|uniref:Plectin-like n=1 Tax=Python bivittatus TaxID=176946 RepID=A0A9F2RE82_PYTBI